MSSISKTPNLNLPQFNRDDRPAWVGDITPAFSAIDTAIGDLRDKTGEIEGQFPGVDQKISGLRADMTELLNNAKQELNQSITEADAKIDTETERALSSETGLESRVEILEKRRGKIVISTEIPVAFFNGIQDVGVNNVYLGLNLNTVEFRFHKDTLLALFPGVLKDTFDILTSLWHVAVSSRYTSYPINAANSGSGTTVCTIGVYNNVPTVRIWMWGMSQLHKMEEHARYTISLTVDREVVNLYE